MAQTDSPPHSIDLSSRLYSAQRYGDLCDLVLACNGQTIPVHKPIVCLQSPVIKAACTGPFVEASGTYEIGDCSFENVQRMVEYLYTGDYRAKPLEQTEEIHDLAIHLAMFSLADVYLIDGLLTLSETKFRDAVKQESAVDVLLRHVPRVYELQCEASRVLREAVVDGLRESIAGSVEAAAQQQALDSLLHEVPEFARDVAMAYVQRPLTGRAGRCLNCASGFVPVAFCWPASQKTPSSASA